MSQIPVKLPSCCCLLSWICLNCLWYLAYVNVLIVNANLAYQWVEILYNKKKICNKNLPNINDNLSHFLTIVIPVTCKYIQLNSRHCIYTKLLFIAREDGKQIGDGSRRIPSKRGQRKFRARLR